MKNKAIIPLVLGLVVGVVAIKYVVDVVKRAKGSNGPTEMIDVIIASSDIQQAAQVTREMIKVVRSPRTPLVTGDRFSKPEDVIARVTAKSIPLGTPILASMLAPPGAKPGLQVKIEEGYRAVSVRIDEVTGVAYQLKPGDYVDVLVVMDVRRGKEPETISHVILQRVQVAAVGQETGDTKEGAAGKAAKSVTLLVPEADVPRIHLAQTKGKLTLAMRGEDDTRISASPGASESELTGVPRAVALGPTGSPEPRTLNPAPVGPKRPDREIDFADVEAQHTVVVVNASPKKTSGSQQRLTFASDHSLKVINQGEGLAPGTSGLLSARDAGNFNTNVAPRRARDADPRTNSAGGRRGDLGSDPSGPGRRDPLDDSPLDSEDKEASDQ